MIEVDKNNFEQEVKMGGATVLVDFWSPNCEKCVAMMPGMEALEKKFSGRVKFCKLNIQGNRRLALALGVRGLPAVKIYQQGEEKAFLTPEDIELEKVEAKINELL